MECPICLEWLPKKPVRCPMCGWNFGPSNHAHGEKNPETESEKVRMDSQEDASPVESMLPFIGRRGEFQEITSFLDKDMVGHPRVALIYGKAGSGKSRLLMEAFARLESPPTIVEWTSERHGSTIVFGPVLNWIRSAAHITPELSLEEVDSHLLELAEKTKDLDASDANYLQAAIGTRRGLKRIKELPEENVRHNVHRIIARLLADQANDSGLCLVLDHAQWLDGATCRWLEKALDGIAGENLMIVALTRDLERGWNPIQDKGADEEKKSKETEKSNLEIRLSMLSSEERGQLFDQIAPALDFLPELREKVMSQEVGTPLFLEELGRLVKQVMAENAGPIHADQVADIIEIVPLSQEDLILKRINLLEKRARMILDVTVMLGMDFSMGLLECCYQISDDLRDQLKVLEGLRILERYDGGEGPRYRFSAGYVREVVYDALLEDQRRTLHAQVARVLEKAFAERLDEQFETLAYHWSRAGNSDQAAYYRIKSADRQARLGEIDSAVENYRKVLEEIKEIAPVQENKARLARVMIYLGRYLRFQGEVDEAYLHLESAQDLAENLGNPFLLAQSQAEWAVTALWHGQSEEASSRLQKLKEQLPELGQPPFECMILNSLAVIDWHAGRFEPALSGFSELAKTAQALGMEHFEADAINNTGLIYWRWSRYAEAAKSFRAAQAIRIRLGDKFGQIAALQNLAIIQEQLGEVQPALKNYKQALEYARQTGFVQGQAMIEINLSNLERRVGLVSSATDHAARGLELAQKISDPLCELSALENLGLAHADSGRVKESLRCLKKSLKLAKKADAAEKATQMQLDLIDIATRKPTPINKGKERNPGTCNGSAATEGSENGTCPRMDATLGENYLEETDTLLKRAESEGYRDLLSLACRLKGRVLNLAETENDYSGFDYLNMALDYAARSQNIFDEKESLVELIAWSDEEERSQKVPKWEKRISWIDANIKRGEVALPT